MSKRYGRQQKRKATEEIARLKSQAGQHSETISAANSVLQMVHDICPNSVVFHPRINNSFSLTMHDFSSPMLYVSSGDSEPPKPVDIRRIDLYALEIEVRKDDFRDCVHFNLSMNNPGMAVGVSSGYTISREGLKHAKTKDIVSQLVDYLKFDTNKLN